VIGDAGDECPVLHSDYLYLGEPALPGHVVHPVAERRTKSRRRRRPGRWRVGGLERVAARRAASHA
jgi:hypothetical protein